MLLLNIEETYPARFKTADFEIKRGLLGTGATTRTQNHRALNYELEVFDAKGNLLGILPGGVLAVNTTSRNSPLIRFFREIGVFREPDEFRPRELEGMNVVIEVNNVCDNLHGLRSVVSRFHRIIPPKEL